MSINQSAVKGFIDGIEEDELVGWFYSPDYEKSGLTLLVDDQPIEGRGSVWCNIPRPDLTEIVGRPVTCGFRVKLRGLDSERIYSISVVHDETGYDFHGEQLRYCPSVVMHAALLRQLFVPEFYRYRYHHESLNNEEAFSHFIKFGIYADHDPNPWVSIQYLKDNHAAVLADYEIPLLGYLAVEKDRLINPSTLFNTEHYQSEHPDLLNEPSYLAHFVSYGHLEGRSYRKLVLHASVRKEIEYLSQFEPDLRHVGPKIDNIVRYPQVRIETYIPRLIKRRFPDRPKAVICVPYLSHGGADLIATFVLTALEQQFGADNVVMIVTDRCEHSVSGWTDDSSNILFLDESERVFGLPNRIDLLHAVVGCLAPDMVVNANSHAAWGMYVHYGKQLSNSIDLNAYLFCFDYNANGLVGGYIRDYLPQALPYMKRLFCDNATVIKDVQTMFGFADDQIGKLHTVYVPVPEGVKTLPDTNFAKSDKPILWIGRFARQKRPELLVDIASRMQTHKFVAFGPAGDSPMSEKIMANEFPNIEYKGVFDQFNELDMSEYSFFLNTSAWEGLPTILIQILASGLPVVTSKAGGISELIDETTGWLVPDDDDPESYLTQIRQLYIHRDVSLKRSASGVDRVRTRHSWDAFIDQLEAAGCFISRSELLTSRVKEFPRLLAS